MKTEQEKQEILFARTLEKVKKQAADQEGVIERKQVREAFADLSLSEEQLQMVFDYLKKNRIGLDEKPEPEEYLSAQEKDYLEEYKRQLKQMEEIQEEQKEAVILAAMAGENQARQRLIHHYLKQVVEISRLYVGQGVFLEDLIGEGNLALSSAVAMLGCLERPEEAEGMLIRAVMDAMEESIAERLSQEEEERKMAKQVNLVAGKAGELAEELRRKVTIQELASETGLSPEDIENAIRISGFSIEDISYE